MRTYRIDEASFSIPDEWKDKSVNVFSPTGELPGDFSFVITRDELGGDQILASYVEGQLEELSKTLPEFRLIRKYQTTVNKAPAFNTEFTWKAEEKTMAQQQTYVMSERVVLVLTATTIEKFSREHRRIIDNIISSFSISR
jgi:hypothetical protein